MARERAGIASVALPGGRIAVFGGEDFGTGRTIGEVELLDTRTRRWRRLPDMRTPRHGLGGVARGKRVYSLLGGPQPGFHFASTVEYLDVPRDPAEGRHPRPGFPLVTVTLIAAAVAAFAFAGDRLGDHAASGRWWWAACSCGCSARRSRTRWAACASWCSRRWAAA